MNLLLNTFEINAYEQFLIGSTLPLAKLGTVCPGEAALEA